jgi:hypothetical protein
MFSRHALNIIEIIVFSTPFKHAVVFLLAGQPWPYLNRFDYLLAALPCFLIGSAVKTSTLDSAGPPAPYVCCGTPDRPDSV